MMINVVATAGTVKYRHQSAKLPLSAYQAETHESPAVNIRY